ncbi:MAG: LysM peptidoglycan-binding domain-containing protein [Thermoleophilaceae bacterium]
MDSTCSLAASHRTGWALWSIARQRLGSEASPAEIARLVEALWSLNEDVIRTGSPDLILPGQKLALPQTR